MADGGYLTIYGIAGGSANGAYPNSIEVLSFSHITQGRQTEGFRFIKSTDSTSTALLAAVNSSKHFNRAVFAWVGKAGLLRFEMTDIDIADFRWTTTGDAFSLYYGAMTRGYTPKI